MNNYVIMLIDLHVHSSLSDCSSLAVEDILAHAGARGLDGVCVTDHGSMDAGLYIDEGVQENGLVVVVGMEYETPDGDFLIFGPFEDINPGLSAVSLLRLVNEKGGAAVAAHPFRANRPVEGYVFQDGLCSVIEVLNGRNTFADNLRAQALLERHPLVPVSGSDAHSLVELGRCATFFDAPVASREDLVNCLNQGLVRPAVKPWIKQVRDRAGVSRHNRIS